MVPITYEAIDQVIERTNAQDLKVKNNKIFKKIECFFCCLPPGFLTMLGLTEQ